MSTMSDPPAVAAWSERGAPFGGGLPSWMAPRHDDDEEEPLPSEPPPARSPSTFSSAPPSRPVVVSVRPATLPPPIRDYEGEIAALQEQLDACMRTMSRMRRRVLEASERDLVQLAMVIAERVVGRELDTQPDLVARWAKDAVGALVAEDSLVVTVSPDVAEVLRGNASWADERNVKLVTDEHLPPGSCEVRGEMGKVDASMAARMAAMADTLGVREDDHE